MAKVVIKRLVMSDLYRPHSCQEISELVSAEVATTLNPAKEYGVRWWNRVSQKSRQVSEPDGNGHRRYRRRTTSTRRDREEWVAVPVPAYLPRSLVERARAFMSAHRSPQRKHLARQWELRGLLRCGCGVMMGTHTTTASGKPYHYYKCSRRNDYKRGLCDQKSRRAEKAEAAIWEFVSRAMKK